MLANICLTVSVPRLKLSLFLIRFRLQFEKETETDINRRKRQAMKPYHPMPEVCKISFHFESQLCF